MAIFSKPLISLVHHHGTVILFCPIFVIQKDENARRQTRGEPPLPLSEEAVEQELNLRPVNPPPRLDALLLGKQVDLRCQQITEIAGGTFGKLYLSEGLQPK